jgi:hypothetical protein
MQNSVRIVSNVIYSIGIVIFTALVGFYLFGAGIVPYPDAMIPYSMRDFSFVGLAIGSIPMFIAAMAVYKFNQVKQSIHRKRNFLLLFSPVFICGFCLVFLIGLYIVMMVMTLLHINGIG